MKTDPMVWLLNAPRRTQQAIAIAVLVLALAIAAGMIWFAFSSFEHARLAVFEKREMLGRLKAIADLKPLLLEREGLAETTTGDFLTGESEAVIRGNLQAELNAFVTANAANLLSIGNIQDLEIGGSRYIGIRVDLSGPIGAVYNTVLSIESAPALLVHEASLWRSGSGFSQPGAQAPEISAQIHVYGAVNSAMVATTGDQP